MNDAGVAGSRVQSSLPGLLVAALIGVCEFNTVLNEAYAYGATLHDSTIFATIIWRSGWLLNPAPALGPASFFNTHVAPINYLPNLASYLYPGDRITYYALVYAIVYGALGFTAYRLIRDVAPPRLADWLGAVAAAALFCSLPVLRGQWEPHMEVVSPLFAVLMFRAWQVGDYPPAIVWLILNAAVREDVGMTYAIPLAMLAGTQYISLRYRDPHLARERLRWGLVLCTISITWSFGAFAVQKIFFPGNNDLLATLYFDPANPFGHLSGSLLLERATHLLTWGQGIWLPVVVLALAAVAFRDTELLVGAVAFLPYALVNFVSKHDMSAVLESYKAFPFATVMLWPAIVALPRPADTRRRYLFLQIVVLACGVFGIHGGRLYFMQPNGVSIAADRWLPQPLTENAEAYRAFGMRLREPGTFGTVRASQGVIALYPYDFGPWYQSNYSDLKLADVPQYDTFIWFVGDRDAAKAEEILGAAGPRDIYRVIGTKIEIATRLPPDQLSVFYGVLEWLPAAGPGM